MRQLSQARRRRYRGIVGPVLSSPWQAQRVRETIADGPDGMPADLLTGVKADEVAAYVAAATK